METPRYECTCTNFTDYSDSERKIAGVMGVPVEQLHNFMDNWEDAYEKTQE